MSEKSEKIYVNLPEVFGKERTVTKDGEEKSFMSFRLPKGTVIRDKDVSGYEFTSNFYGTSEKFGRKEVYACFMNGNWNITLKKSAQVETGAYVVVDEFGVKPEELSTAVKEARKNYQMEHSFAIKDCFVKHCTSKESGREFVAVSIPSGVTVNGKDIGGYSVTFPKEAVREAKNGYQMVSFSNKELIAKKDMGAKNADGKWEPKLDEKGNKAVDTVKISGADLKAGLAQAREAFLNQNAPEVEPQSR